ncbi:hypothetical protein [Micromonospora parathelypteridis]|uniref:Uncharacterized protein n=1 Tax=Micromonospora parathelypteridis TaxID=1839617 RepID=A0A840W6H0_9ACTN|nr:hypothetical protein [Micromonospora parathelypteridis]MBB5478691.1 hypothetical protein [Micromonospora parathelypteridis]GGO05041.1 hypothetical protein GCM10011576_07180 [Micromonospora parathelypteridis]
MSLSGLGDSPVAQPPALFPAPEPGEPTPGTSASGASRRRGGSAHPGPAQTEDAGRQLVFFGAEAAEPTVADLAGLLAGPGEVVRMGGTARLSVQVDAAWRVHVLVAELASRGLAASWEPTEGERHAVRTSYTRVLKPLAAAWLHGPAKRPPATFHLTGRRLRLWLAAAGTPEPPGGFLLRLGADDAECWERIGVALAAAGLAGTLVSPGEGGPAFRITGRRRLGRLAELVGGAPPAAPADGWPTRP